MQRETKKRIISIILGFWQELVKLAKEYGLSEKIYKIIIESSVLIDIQNQIEDFALIAVYQAEFTFNKIGKEKKVLAFKMICNFIKYPAFLKPFKPLVEKVLCDRILEEIEQSVSKLKERLQQ